MFEIGLEQLRGRCVGVSCGGDEGAELVAHADEFMLGQEIVEPQAAARGLAPGIDVEWMRDDQELDQSAALTAD